MFAEEHKIYVGRLAPRTEEETLRRVFARFGDVASVDLYHRYAFIVRKTLPILN
jgi:RNA recognition motif-containing protein